MARSLFEAARAFAEATPDEAALLDQIGRHIGAAAGIPCTVLLAAPGIESEPAAAGVTRVPLSARGDQLGVVDLGPGDATDLELARQLADLAALAVANGRLASTTGDATRARVFLDAVVENIPAMIFVKDAERLSFVRFNRAGEQLLGLPRAELLGKNDHDFFPPDEAAFFQAKDRETLVGKRLVDIPEEEIQTGNGTRWLHTRKVPILDEQGEPRYLLGISEDITDRRASDRALKALNDVLQQRTRELSASNRELEAFTYSVSHDLRAPLRAIDGFSKILVEDHHAQLDDEGKRVLGVIRRNTLMMGRLIDDLLTFSRLGRQAIALSTVAMTALARSAADEARIAYPGRTIEITIDPLPEARCDPALMRQVWSNLLDNALKYSAPRAATQVHVSGRVEGHEAQYTVRDNGVGFDMQYVGKLFGVFQRLHRPNEFEGTGVGLALVQRILQRHGGRVWADGELGVGALFGFALPMNGDHGKSEDSRDPAGRGQ
ncbi:MAG TPA: ATP-binding protein [Kofleriaceae bacterium]|nr:ATP-binding protein [Kofleriaceae bacterium]